MQRYEKMSRDDLARLLARAEQALKVESAQDALRQLHDLELHQIELELSNRDLAATQRELEVSRDRFATLFDFAPVAYLGLDRNGMVEQSNLAAAGLFGVERAKLDGLPLSALLGKGNRARALTYVRAAFTGDGVTSDEFQVAAKAGDVVRDLRLDSCITAGPDGYNLCLTVVTEITDLRAAQRRLSESHQQLSTLIAAAPIGMGVTRQRVFQSVSPNLTELLGFAEQDLIGKSARVIYPDSAEFERVGHVKYAALAAGKVGELETVMRRRDGALIDVLLRSAALDPSDLDAGVVFTVLDISARKRIERELEAARQQLELALAGGDLGTYKARIPGGPVEADGRYLAMLGYRPGELELDWDSWLEMVHPDDRAVVEKRGEPVLQGDVDTFEAEYRMRHRQGQWVWVMDRARAYDRDSGTGAFTVAGTHVDITRRREAEGRVIYLVEHDALTGLLNRRGLMRSIETICSQAERAGRPFALALLDLDHFKEVNDAYGHSVGDVVLRDVGGALHEEVRSADWVGRWGGEEFIIVMPESTEATAMATVERVRAHVGSREITTNGFSIRITLSAGLAVFQPGEDTPQAVIERADAAMYLAKQRGRNCAIFAGAEDGQAAINIATAIRTALHDNAIEVRPRPILDARTGMSCGEALVGWIGHPACGTFDVRLCLAVAQQLGLMCRIDRLLIQAACERLAAEAPADKTQTRQAVFVRLSSDSLRRSAHIGQLAEYLTATPAERIAGLVLTINEAQVALSPEQIAAALQPLLDCGCKLGIDGFGGQGSTSRFLIDLPASYVVIDPELVRISAGSSRARAALAGLLQTARDLDCITVAECTGDQATQQHLTELGIDWLITL